VIDSESCEGAAGLSHPIATRSGSISTMRRVKPDMRLLLIIVSSPCRANDLPLSRERRSLSFRFTPNLARRSSAAAAVRLRQSRETETSLARIRAERTDSPDAGEPSTSQFALERTQSPVGQARPSRKNERIGCPPRHAAAY